MDGGLPVGTAASTCSRQIHADLLIIPAKYTRGLNESRRALSKLTKCLNHANSPLLREPVAQRGIVPSSRRRGLFACPNRFVYTLRPRAEADVSVAFLNVILLLQGKLSTRPRSTGSASVTPF